MKGKNKIIIISTSIAVLILGISLIACGKMTDQNESEASEEVANQLGLVSSETRWDEACTKAEATDLLIDAMIKDDSIEVYSYKQGEISGYEVNTPETDTALEGFEVINPNFNGDGGRDGILQETEQTYITYTDLDPTTMYVTSATSTYHDPNISEGELVVSGLTEPNQEILIDGKATLNGVDYYRLAFQPEMMLNHQIIIPAEFVSSENQQQEVQQQPEVQPQQPEVQQPEVQQPEVQHQNPDPEWDASLGVSKEDWDAFFGGSNTTGQHTWQPDHGNATQDANGNWVGDVGLTPEELEKSSNMTVY